MIVARRSLRVPKDGMEWRPTTLSAVSFSDAFCVGNWGRRGRCGRVQPYTFTQRRFGGHWCCSVRTVKSFADRQLPTPPPNFSPCLRQRLFGEFTLVEQEDFPILHVVIFWCESSSLAPLAQVSTHTRFLFTLRSNVGIYHSLLLFRLSGPVEGTAPDSFYVMESACPHLGADLSHAEIEECGSDVVAVCPWHR